MLPKCSELVQNQQKQQRNNVYFAKVQVHQNGKRPSKKR